MNDHTLQHGRKYFHRYCLQVFSKAYILKNHVNDCFKINGKLMIKMPQKGKYLKFENMKGEQNHCFMIYEDFESKLVP